MNNMMNPNYDDQFLFETLCLNGASVGLSWKAIERRRESYRDAFYRFDIDACAEMDDEELEALLDNEGVIRSRNKIFSVRKNARAVQRIQKEFGSFNTYVQSFNNQELIREYGENYGYYLIFELPKIMSRDMKERGISYVGPTVMESFLRDIWKGEEQEAS